MKKYLGYLCRLLKAAAKNPGEFGRVLNMFSSISSAHHFSRTYKEEAVFGNMPPHAPGNPLWDYFQNHKEGRGIWKWEHYFEIYHRHFSRFVGQKVDVLEIGIFSGGSLEMWRSYFGAKSHIYGVDIEEACKAYENDHTSVFVGDQADRAFWKNFRKSVDGMDIIIDDGGHTAEQQQITLEEMLPHLRPGGVYLCEDIHDIFNGFSGFATSLARELNLVKGTGGSTQEFGLSQFQASIHSIHFYPFVVVIEKHGTPPEKLSAPRHGTTWQPFL